MPHQPARHGRNQRAYRRAAKRAIANNPVCWLCGQYINPDLPYTHAMAGTADHVETLATGGDILGELRPAHRSCNSRRGDGTNQRAQRPPRSSAW